jgi:hypothetical protein
MVDDAYLIALTTKAHTRWYVLPHTPENTCEEFEQI